MEQRLCSGKRESGLTLIELLVVLSILTVLSTVALRSVVGTFEENNYDANISQLDQIELAILGSENQPGFVSDIGRLPEAVGDAEYDPDSRTGNLLTQLQELWSQGAFPSYAVNQADELDSEVRLGTGWRGPYLNLGVNRDDLTDGFANPYLSYEADGTLADDTEPISIIQSFGSNGSSQFGTTGVIETFPDATDTSYEEDVEMIFEAGAAAVTSNLVTSEVPRRWETQLNNIQVEREDGAAFVTADGQYLILRAYGPNDGTLQAIFHEVIDLNDIDTTGGGDSNGSVESADSPTAAGGEWVFSPPGFQFTGPSLPNGPKVFRAYQVDDATTPFPEPGAADEIVGDGDATEPTLTVEWKSPPIFITVGSPQVPPTIELYEVP